MISTNSIVTNFVKNILAIFGILKTLLILKVILGNAIVILKCYKF